MATRERRQEAAFVKWINAQFTRANRLNELTRFESLARDIKSGVKLILLLSVVCPTVRMPTYNENPKTLFAQMENINRAIKMAAAGGIKTVGIGADNIANGNLMLILGLVWSIIYHVNIGAIRVTDGQQGRSGREGLLFWCQKQTAPYAKHGVNVVNFTSCWQSGLALSAIIHNNRPELISFNEMKDLRDPRKVVTKCITVAGEELGIPHLLEVEDMLIADDEKVIMAYISEFFTLFFQQAHADDAVRRARTFVERQRVIREMITKYETAAIALEASAAKALEKTSIPVQAPSLEAAWQQLQMANRLRDSVGKDLLAPCQSLIASYDNIQLNLKTHHLRPYETAEGVPDGPRLKHTKGLLMTRSWDLVRQATEHYTAAKDVAETEYITLMKELSAWVKLKEQEVAKAYTGDADEAPKKLAAIYEELEHGDLFLRTKKAVEYLEANGVPHYSVTASPRWDEMSWRYTEVKVSVLQNKASLEKGTALDRDVPQAQLDEYHDVFRRFAVDQTDRLTISEFTNCLKALGIQIPDKELQLTFKRFAKKGGMSAENFIAFLRECTSDTLSKEQVLVSFRAVAQNKPYIAREHLQSLLGEDLACFCDTHFPKCKDGGLDYVRYINHLLVS